MSLFYGVDEPTSTATQRGANFTLPSSVSSFKRKGWESERTEVCTDNTRTGANGDYSAMVSHPIDGVPRV